MPSSPESNAYASGVGFTSWNRKVHFYLGLYFLFFVWLFALTGLLLNHSEWQFAQFWPGRQISNSEHSIQQPAGTSSLDVARDISGQLGIVGEIEWLTTRPEPTRLDFRVNRPGLNIEVKADLQAGRATVQRTKVNAWGTTRVLHTFTGVRANDPRKNQRDWIVTTAWAWAMDAVAIGLILMVGSGLVMWWNCRANRCSGLFALVAGSIVCATFVVGLCWILR